MQCFFITLTLMIVSAVVSAYYVDRKWKMDIVKNPSETVKFVQDWHEIKEKARITDENC